MKKIKLLFLAMSVAFIACNKEDDESNPAGGGKYKVEYKSQDMQGKINGDSWQYVIGEVHSSEGGFEADYTHNFEMADTAQADSCFLLTGERSKVIFGLGDDNKLLQVGKYPLSFDWSSWEGNTVTLVAWTSETVLNTIATEGEYEIISVDTVNQIVTGRIDAFADDDNFVNGNFTLKYCYWD